MFWRRYQFRWPGPVPILLTLVLVPAMVGLGFWQLDRAAQKAALRDQRQANAQRPAVALVPGMDDPQALLFRRVTVRGRLRLDRQFLLENRKYRSQPGYWVLAPLQLQDSRTHVVVIRGWIAQGPDRRTLPDLPPAGPAVAFTGRIVGAPSVGMELGTPDAEGTGWPRPIAYVDLAWMARELGVELLPYTVQRLDGPDNGLVRDWDVLGGGENRMPPERHVSYAVQWFTLAAALVIIFVVVNLRRREPSAHPEVERGSN